MKRILDEVKAKKFYEVSKKKLEGLAKRKGISDLSEYYELTDFKTGNYGKLLTNLGDELSSVFLQMAFHAQNAYLISNIVDFENNLEFLKETLCGFDPKAFLNQYHEESEIVAALIYDEKTGKGLKYNREKSKENNRDSLVKRYAGALLDCAQYLKDFQNRKEFIKKVYEQYTDLGVENFIRKFRLKVTHGFSVALTCDFFKELDKNFSDLCKPDIHIKDVLVAFFGKKDNYYNSEKKEYECIEEMRELVKIINDGQDEKITVYQFDRMIWLICSGRFFLHESNDVKKHYLKEISAIKETNNELF